MKTEARLRLRTALFALAAGALIALSALASWHVRRENGLRSLQAINESRIELVASAVRSEINRQDHLPLVLSLDDWQWADVDSIVPVHTSAYRVGVAAQSVQQ